MHKIKAMILAAGFGKRLGALGENLPKALIEIDGSPIIDQIIKKLIALNIEEIIINCHHLGDKLKAYIFEQNYPSVKIKFSDESPQPLETGGGIKQALKLIGSCDALLVHNVDVYSDIPLEVVLDFHFKNKLAASLVLQKRESSRVFICDEELNLCGWKNLKTGEVKYRSTEYKNIENENYYPFSGIQCLSPDFLARLANYKKEAFSIVDFYLDQNNADIEIKGLDLSQYKWFDLGTVEKIAKASKGI